MQYNKQNVLAIALTVVVGSLILWGTFVAVNSFAPVKTSQELSLFGGRTEDPGQVEGDLTATGDAVITGNATIGGTLGVTGTSTLATTTISQLNGTIVVDGVTYPQTGAGIQSAVNACSADSGCGEVYIPAGNYTVSASITLPSHIKIYGAASSTILTLANSVNDSIFKNSDQTNGNEFIDVGYMTMYGNKANNTSGVTSAVQLKRVSHGRVHHIEAYDFDDQGIDIGSGGGVASEYIWIENNVIKNSDRNNIYVGVGTKFFLVENNYLSGATNASSEGYGLHVGDPLAGQVPWKGFVRNNHCFDNQVGGLLIGGQDMVVEGNICDDNDDHGIKVQTTSTINIRLIGNQTNNNGGHGIIISKGASNIEVIGHTSKDNVQIGLLIDKDGNQPSDINILGGSFSNNQKEGIQSLGNNVVISGVSVEDNTFDGIELHEGNSTVSNSFIKNNTLSGIGILGTVSTSTKIVNNVISDDQDTPTQDYGIDIDSSASNITIYDNDISGNVSGTINNNGSNVLIREIDDGHIGSTFNYNATSTGYWLFQNANDSTESIRVLDADGGDPVLIVDTTNERIGTGMQGSVLLPQARFHINGTDEAQLLISGALNAQNETAGVDFRFNDGISTAQIARVLATVSSATSNRLELQTADGNDTYSTQLAVYEGGGVVIGGFSGATATTTQLFVDGNTRLDGNLGISSSTPTYQLSVGNNFSVDSSGNATTTGALVVGNPANHANKNTAGTITAQAVYDDAVLLTDYVFDYHFDGQMSREDQMSYPDFEIMSIEQTRDFTEKERHLPTIDGRDVWEEEGRFSIGKIVTQIWETVEVQATHIWELFDRQDEQEKEIEELEQRLERLEAQLTMCKYGQ